ncbi:hypothetical protein E2C01_069371 [Portunus trituberculatus]|uniref:Uncharacterized protein n=1 Tax=Portunus trituberculatus TaxID=210409 RepID=A0A5B7I204_PORTR|nr:hypothetical protein [Portunus trituberculatus]
MTNEQTYDRQKTDNEADTEAHIYSNDSSIALTLPGTLKTTMSPAGESFVARTNGFTIIILFATTTIRGLEGRLVGHQGTGSVFRGGLTDQHIKEHVSPAAEAAWLRRKLFLQGNN